ncbi:Imm72 family immunity protein [Yersinia mollaretii]|uniref:Uncharacterized protein conserved in bacteria n=1 Tax=Yersinia mollaretii TaxID=33060 RepID=A0AA36LNF4_YERMO|nr:Imm72 family immunity protein [Yersinia mollaretii]MDA5525636.1 Imm72 family immunity protein [Yersinia mollaretii]MDR7871737.1 Imm72 family immunity protein [Yersinia mollaretii]PHZ29795.1 hypothetical protein CS537_20645 [Yersinia mollaretii]WQC73713.1 Imm72 family immunity protein [Yersinia mollaretii]CNH51225.1 Uncharacterized protein conserved in bacteria [Yersinia mollaretii]
MIIEKSKYPMTDDQIRRRLFWLLQRLSSYSLWQRKRDAWAYFAEKYEEALKTWPEDKSDGFDPEAIIWIYEALRLYDEGLPELAAGNRQVWQRMTGAFHQLARPVDLVHKFFYPRCHERWTQVEAYPSEVEKLNKLRIAAGYWGDNLLYPPHNNVCNFFDASYLLDPENYHWEFEREPYPVFPKNLPPVPERSDIIIKTGELVPCDGIWEPVTLQYHRKLLVIQGDICGFKNLGAFNYFIRGMNAPLQSYLDSLLQDGYGYRDIHWRLIWEDTRYCDNIIPDESEYFLDDNPGKRITCESGDHCPYTGRWATLAGGQQQFAHINVGGLMPEATQYQSDIFVPVKLIPATWSLLHRDDEGSVFLNNA